MTPIEHFLIDIVQILFRDWIEKIIADTGRYVDPTDIFQPTLHNIFYKCRPIMYLHGRVSFVVRCLLQNLQCRLVWFFRASSTDAVFRSTMACSHFVGQENISPPRKKSVALKKMGGVVCECDKNRGIRVGLSTWSPICPTQPNLSYNLHDPIRRLVSFLETPPPPLSLSLSLSQGHTTPLTH